jgi:predicted transcriptional regulator
MVGQGTAKLNATSATQQTPNSAILPALTITIFPQGCCSIPYALSEPLRAWHERLGVSEVTIAERLDDKNKSTGEYTLHIAPVEPQRCTLGAGVVDAHYAYLDALRELLASNEVSDLDSSYIRFAEKALRIAMLLASFSNDGRIELSHWARAQQIAERWRRSLHNLIDQLGQSEDSPERTQEMKVLRVLERRGALPTRDVARFANISTGEAQRILDQLTKVGELRVEPGKRTKRYRLTQAAASVVPSQVSQPTQNYDTSVGQVGKGEEVSYNNKDYDINDYTTVATLPEDEPRASLVEEDDDRHEELMEMWLSVGNVDAADSEAELIDNLERKLRARLWVDEARGPIGAGCARSRSARGRLELRATPICNRR